MLWIDVGDQARNDAIFHDMREHTDTTGLDFDVEWDPKESSRACAINGQPIEGCGWLTPPDQRAGLLQAAAERCAAFKAAIEPHIAAAYQRATVPAPHVRL